MAQPRLLLLLVLLGAACKQPYPEPPKLDAGPDTGLPGMGVGGACLQDGDCRQGLNCKVETKTCQPPGNKVPGSTCILSDECLPGNYCAMGTCQVSGKVAEGGACTREGDCASGLTCNLAGLSGTCGKPGLGDLGAACMQTSGCRAGLICANGSCQTMATMPPPAMGACFDDEPLPVAKVHFHVPRAADTSEDFYRLPFPNDIRLKNGKVSLTGHPKVGPNLLGVDLVDRYLRAIEAEATGFSTNPLVFFRFSRNPNFESLKVAGAVGWVNITPSSPQYGQVGQPGWYSSTGREKYICPRWIAVRHNFGSPLRPGETYAFFLKTSVTDDKGAGMQADDDFKAMLAASQPMEAELSAAWTAYAPLRAWIADKKFDGNTLAAAAVFTTEKVEEPLARMRAAVRAAAAPVVKGLIKCGEAKSPCDDGKTGPEHLRGCFAASAAFDEYQGTVSLPVFQKGTPPYDQPSDGGGVEFEGGMAKIQRTEDVCFSLTVPKGAAPEAGWPVVVYSHGTGGSYQSFVEQGLAAEFATGEVGGGAAVPMAMLGYDGALHGSRKGTSTKPVTELFYNFMNPLAARDNSLQATADLFALARAVETFSAGGIKLNAAKLGLYGHSQGGNAAANAVPFEPLYGAVALSGTGGTLILSLLHKTQPVNIPQVLPFALGETKVIDENHPVLNLLQMYLDRADPVNYGRRLFSDPIAPAVPRHALHVFGTSDTYSPEATQRTYAQSAGFVIVGPVVDPVDMKDIAEMRKLPAIAAPAKGNLTTAAGAAITAVQAQYAPTGKDDGHFVSTQNPAARKAVRQMLGTFVRDGVPTVTP
jgi:predicted esterase